MFFCLFDKKLHTYMHILRIYAYLSTTFYQKFSKNQRYFPTSYTIISEIFIVTARNFARSEPVAKPIQAVRNALSFENKTKQNSYRRIFHYMVQQCIRLQEYTEYKRILHRNIRDLNYI